MNERRAIAFESLGRIEGLGDLLLQTLYNYGYQSAQAVADGDTEVLAQIPGMDLERANELVEGARTAVASEHAEAGIRMELARDQACRTVDRRSRRRYGRSRHGVFSQLAGVSAGLISACQEVGLTDPADWYFEALSVGLEDFAIRFNLSDSRTWVIMHGIEKALVESAEGDWDLLIDAPSAEDFEAAQSEAALDQADAEGADDASEVEAEADTGGDEALSEGAAEV